MYTVEFRVMRREFEKGKARFHDFRFDAQVETEVPSKYNLFINCCRQFGRCTRRIPMGWRFERRETFSDGSVRWVEYEVTMLNGAERDPGFKLVNQSNMRH